MSKKYYRIVTTSGSNYTLSYSVTNISGSTMSNGTFIPFTFNNVNYVGDGDYTSILWTIYRYTVNYSPRLIYYSSTSVLFNHQWSLRVASDTYLSFYPSNSASTGYGGYITSLATGNQSISVTDGTLIETKTINGKWVKKQDNITSNWATATGFTVGGEAIDVKFAYNGVSGYKMILFSMELSQLAFCTSYLNLTTSTSSDISCYKSCLNLVDDYITLDITTSATIEGDGIFDFGDVEQEVPETFYNWLTANFEAIGPYTFTFYTATGEVIGTESDKFAITEMTLSTVVNAQTLTITFANGSTATLEWVSDVPEGYYFAGISRVQGSSNIFIEPNSTSTTEVSASSDFYEVFLKYGDLPNVEFEIDLMQNTAENNRVDKTNYLTAVATLSGALRHQSSVVNPTILIDYSTTGATIPDFNYVHILAFNRYYYLTDLISVRTGLWQMVLQCDVLMSYKDNILAQYAYINRSSNNYNDFIQDHLQPMTSQKNITRIDVTDALNDTNYPRYDLTQQRSGYSDAYCYIVSVLTKDNTVSADSGVQIIDNNQEMRYQSMQYNTTNYTVKWLMTYSQLNTFMGQLVNPSFWNMIKEYFTNFDNSAVISVIGYPRNLYEVFQNYYKQWNNNQTMQVTDNVVVFNTSLSGTSGIKLTANTLNQRWYTGSLTFERVYNNFLDYDGYVKTQIYLPCIGIIDIPTNVVINKTVDIFYVIDWETGGCTAFLETTGDDGNRITLGTYQGHYGVELAVVSSDYGRIVTNGITGALSSSISGQVQAVFQVASGDVAGGVSSIVNSTNQAGIQALSIFSTPAGVQATKSGTGIETGFMSGKPYAIVTRTIPVEVDNFADILGRPAGVYTQLANLNGYTVVGMVHLQDFDTATRGETDEIEQRLYDGVMLIGASEGTLTPSTLAYVGAVGSNSVVNTVTLTDSEGNAINISSVTLINTELGNNITYTIDGNTITFTCNFAKEANGNYTARIYDAYNNKYSLTISLEITPALTLSNSYVYFDNVQETQTATFTYTGEIVSITNPDEEHIAVDFDNSTGALTVTYTDPDSTASSVAYLSIEGTATTISFAVYTVFPLTVNPDSITVVYNESSSTRVTVTSSGSDLNGGGFTYSASNTAFGITTDNKTYITIDYDASTVEAGAYTLTLTDIFLGTTATITINVVESAE